MRVLIADLDYGGAGCHPSGGMLPLGWGEFLGRGTAERRMGPAAVVVEPPGLDDLAGIGEIEEPVLVEMG